MPARSSEDTVSFLTNIPNGFNEDLHAGLRRAGFDVRVRYEGLPSSIGRPWAVTPIPPDRVASNVWDERDALRPPAHDRIGAVILGGWSNPRAIQRRLAAAATHRGTNRSVLYWGERMNHGPRRVEIARQAYFQRTGLDGVLAIGSHAVDSYRRATRGKVPVHVLPYTTDRGLEVQPDRAAAPVVGFVGRLVPLKNIDTILRALGSMPRPERPRLEIVGSGPAEQDLRTTAAALDLDVTFFGEVAPDEVAAHRRRWWASLLPSREIDGWGLAVPESLNSGIPVVASGYVGAAVDLIRDGLNGAIVDRDAVDDADAWAEALRPVLSGEVGDPHSIRAMAAPFLPDRAADWLARLLREPGDDREASFIEQAWHTFDAAARPVTP